MRIGRIFTRLDEGSHGACRLSGSIAGRSVSRPRRTNAVSGTFTHGQRAPMRPDAEFVAAWAGSGMLAGTAFAMQAHGLLTTGDTRGLPSRRMAATLATGALFGVLAYRFGPHFDLLPYSYLAAVGVAASTVDVIEQRLPSELILPAYAVLGVLFATSAILGADAQNLLRALAGATTLTILYLIIGLASRGGLGAGDVKFGGLLGMALGWSDWSAIVTATILAWLSAALVTIFARSSRTVQDIAPVPMGPFLLGGTLAAITLQPI